MTRHNIYWETVNKNNEILTEHNIVYKDIDRKNVKKFSLKNGDTELYSITLEPEDSFLYRRRVKTDGSTEEVCYIIAKFTSVGKKIAFIFPQSDSLVIKDNFIGNHRWFYPVVTSEFEIHGDR